MYFNRSTQELCYNTAVDSIESSYSKEVYVMKLCKRSIITSSLLAVLAISSAYGTTLYSQVKAQTAVVDMDYSNIPELKNLSKAQHLLWCNLRLMLLMENLLKDKPIYSTVTMSGNRVVSVKLTKLKKNKKSHVKRA